MAKLKTNRGLVETSLEEIEARTGVNATSPAAAKSLGAESPEQAAAAGTQNHVQKVKQNRATADQTLEGSERLDVGRREANAMELEAQKTAGSLRRASSLVPQVDTMIQTHLDRFAAGLVDSPEGIDDTTYANSMQMLLTGKVIKPDGTVSQHETGEYDDVTGHPIMEDDILTFGTLATMLPAADIAKIKSAFEEIGLSDFENTSPEELRVFVETEKAKELEKGDEIRARMADAKGSREYAALAKELKDLGQVGSVAAEQQAEEALVNSEDFIDEVGASPEKFASIVAGDDEVMAAEIVTAIQSDNKDVIDGLTSHGSEDIKLANEVADSVDSSPSIGVAVNEASDEGWVFDPTWTDGNVTHDLTTADLFTLNAQYKLDPTGMDLATADDEYTGAATFALRNNGQLLTEEQLEDIITAIPEAQKFSAAEELVDDATEIINSVENLDELTPEQEQEVMETTLEAMGVPLTNYNKMTENLKLFEDPAFMYFAGEDATLMAAIESVKTLDANGDGVFDVNDMPTLLERITSDPLYGAQIADVIAAGGEYKDKGPAGLNTEDVVNLQGDYSIPPERKAIFDIVNQGLSAEDAANKVEQLVEEEIINIDEAIKIFEDPKFKELYPNQRQVGFNLRKNKWNGDVQEKTDFYEEGLLGIFSNQAVGSRMLLNPSDFTGQEYVEILQQAMDHIEVLENTAKTPTEKAAAAKLKGKFESTYQASWAADKKYKKDKDIKSLTEIKINFKNPWARNNKITEFAKKYGMTEKQVRIQYLGES